MAEAVPSAAGFNFLDWLSKPGSQNLLAGIGSRLDPQGVGAALGQSTIAYNQSRVAAERADAQEKKLGDQRTEALKILGLTPSGTPGPTKIEAKKDGNIVQTSDVGTSNLAAPSNWSAPTGGNLLKDAATGTSAEAPIMMPATTVTAQREPPAAPAANPYANNVRQFDVRQVAPFS